jgi:hypothetical protein
LKSAPTWIEARVESRALAVAETYARNESGRLSGSSHHIVRVSHDEALFVFDVMLWFPAQSGSDEYEHYIFCGRARLEVDRRELEDWRCELRQYLELSEHAVDWAEPDHRFDRRAELKRVAKRFLGSLQ